MPKIIGQSDQQYQDDGYDYWQTMWHDKKAGYEPNANKNSQTEKPINRTKFG